MNRTRIKIACFDFTGCEGCQLAKVNLEEELVPLCQYVEFVQFREAMDPIGDDYTIAFIEGSISTPSCVRRIRAIREKAAVLVAVGSCSTYGGLQAMRNGRELAEVKREGYPGFDASLQLESLPWSLPVSKVVKVDYAIPGCPLDKHEFLKVVKQLLLGKTPTIPTHAVCTECKRLENECVYDLGYTCMGPVTRAGCGARCPQVNSPCIGCRGLVPDLNRDAQMSVLAQHGLTTEDCVNSFRTFNAYTELDDKADEIATVLAGIAGNGGEVHA